MSSFNFGPRLNNCLSVKELVDESLQLLKQGSYQSIASQDNKHETQFLKLDSRQAQRVLGWQPHLNINETLELTFNWYKKFYNNDEDMGTFTNNQIDSFFNL